MTEIIFKNTYDMNMNIWYEYQQKGREHYKTGQRNRNNLKMGEKSSVTKLSPE